MMAVVAKDDSAPKGSDQALGYDCDQWRNLISLTGRLNERAKSVTRVGFEPTPFRTRYRCTSDVLVSLVWRLRPLGHLAIYHGSPGPSSIALLVGRSQFSSPAITPSTDKHPRVIKPVLLPAVSFPYSFNRCRLLSPCERKISFCLQESTAIPRLL